MHFVDGGAVFDWCIVNDHIRIRNFKTGSSGMGTARGNLAAMAGAMGKNLRNSICENFDNHFAI